MSSHATPTTPTHDGYYRAVLHDLIDMGMDLARNLHRHATQAPAPEPAQAPTPDPTQTIAFDRIARAVRRTVLLARSLDHPARQPLHAPDRVAARRQIIRHVEDRIQWAAGDEDPETLHAEFLDRLDTPEFEDEIDTRPIPDIITDICHDLGLFGMPGAYRRRTPADLAVLHARAAGHKRPTPQPNPAPARAANPARPGAPQPAPTVANILLHADRFRGR